MRFLTPSRNQSVLTLFLLSALYIVLSSRSAGVASQLNDDKTGAPGTGGATCGNCHNNGAYGTVVVSINLFVLGTNTPVTAYTPGTTYDMRVRVQPSSGTPAGYGFQMTCLTTTGNTPVAGYSNLGTNVKQKTITTGTFNGRTYVEQNGVVNNNQFLFQWTAPAAGTGSVTFYASGNAVNNLGTSAGDNSGASSLVVPVASTPIQLSGTQTNVNCFGASTGSINLTVTGGSAPFTFNWSDGATTEDRTGLTAGTYTVTATDNSSATATASYTISQPASALSVSGIVSPILCAGASTGSINVTTQGGTAPYTFNWGSGITTEDRANLVAGTYQITVTDALSCTASQSFTLSQPSALQISKTTTAVSCNGLSNGGIQVNVTGGVLPYNYNWSDGFTSEDRQNLSAGSYTLTVTDQNGCSASSSAVITQPTALQANANNGTIACSGGSAQILVTASGGTAPYSGTGTFTVNLPGNYSYPVTDANGCVSNAQSTISSPNAPVVSGSPTDVSCAGGCTGSVQVNITGGTPPYQYNWSSGQNTQNISQLCAGMYTQTVTDQTGCAVQSIFFISQPDPLTVSLSGEDTVCRGESTEFQASPSGGTSPYTYSWPQNGTGNSWTALTAGNYTLTVTDAQNCSLLTSFSVTESDTISISISQTSPDNGSGNGSIDIQVSGGVPPFSFNWSNGQITEDIAQISQGVYAVTVTDSKGCQAISQEIPILLTAIPEDLQQFIQIYPNPVKESVQILIPENDTQGRLSIIGLSGQRITERVLTPGIHTMEMTNLPSGIWIAEWHTKTSISRIRLIKP